MFQMTVSNRPTSGPLAGMVAPLSGQSSGLQKAQVTNGIRNVGFLLCAYIYIHIYNKQLWHLLSCYYYLIITVNIMQR